jgi:hypothetical protein
MRVWSPQQQEMGRMTETVTADHSPGAADRPQSAMPAIVSAKALARHLDCSATYIGKLEAEGVIQRQGDGFPLDQSRIAYLRFLRRERRQSPRSEADAEFQRAKTELLRIRIAEKHKTLMLASEHEAFVEMLTGMFLTGLSGFAARCGGRDLAVRREIDRAVFDLRKEISETASRMADQAGEPPLDAAKSRGQQPKEGL